MNEIDMRWYEEDLVLKRYSATSPYRQGEPTINELREELDKYVNSVPNLVTLAQFDVIRQPKL
ncbi:MAG: hypothetical protein AABW84_02460 [Nanoarchaeota archaeon]